MIYFSLGAFRIVLFILIKRLIKLYASINFYPKISGSDRRRTYLEAQYFKCE